VEGEKNPKVLFERFQSGKLDNKTFFDSLISLIENSDDRDVRVESIELLSELDSGDPRLFKIFQDLLISDLDEDVRSISAKLLVSKYFEESVGVLEWAIKNELSVRVLAELLERLNLRDPSSLKRILIEEFEELLNKGNDELENIKSYFYNLKNYFSENQTEQVSSQELMDIYLNYKILMNLEKIFNLNYYGHDCFSRNGYLTRLDLGGLNLESISEIKGLQKLSKLESLNLIGNKVIEISGLENFTELKSLNLSWNKISKIKGLKRQNKLIVLNLEENQITEISGLESLVNLEELRLMNNKISRITGLDNLKNLEYLALDGNNITEISGLQGLHNLIELTLINNQILEIKGLHNLKKLQRLALINNRIKEFKGLTKLKSLKHLELEGNELTSVKGIKKLKKLDSAFLSGNDIPDEELIAFYSQLEKKVKKRNLKESKAEASKSSSKLS